MLRFPEVLNTQRARWHAFCGRHFEWADARATETDVVYCLPDSNVAFGQLRALFQLTAAEIEVEQEFLKLCKLEGTLGLRPDRESPWVLYRWLDPTLDLPEPFEANDVAEVDWTKQNRSQCTPAVDQMTSVARRVQGGLGALICRPEFCSERDALRSQWLALPEEHRPQFPLSITFRRSTPFNFVNSTDEEAVKRFVIQFAEFRRRWPIRGMVAWELPEPDGVHWPVQFPSSDETPDGSISFRTPPNFPIQDRDGLGRLVAEAHAVTCVENGFDDLSKWETYSKIFLIEFWRGVFERRYADRQRRCAKTAIDHAISATIGLSYERVEKYRKAAAAMRSGRRKSLRDLR